jgi:hypothetical protein
MEKRIQTVASLRAPSFSAHLDKVLLRDGKEGLILDSKTLIALYLLEMMGL